MAKSFYAGVQNGDAAPTPTPTTLPRPAQLSGTFYLKLLGVEGLIDLYSLRQANLEMDVKSPPPRTYSASSASKNSTRNFMTLPNPHHRERDRDRDRERAAMATEDDGVPRYTRRGSKGRKNNLQKQHSLDHIDDPASECLHGVFIHTCGQ